jgi:hypothetical protein
MTRHDAIVSASQSYLRCIYGNNPGRADISMTVVDVGVQLFDCSLEEQEDAIAELNRRYCVEEREEAEEALRVHMEAV